MDPHTEALSLKKDPLPVLVTPEDEFLPSSIYQLDLSIAEMQERLMKLQQQRSELINRALEVNILEDPFCRIERKVRSVRIVNAEKFRATFPKEFDLICEMQRNELQRQMQDVGGFIPVGVADKFIPKKDSAACVDLKESVSYAVVRKETEGS
jgi:hypothetical protein